jgi:TonB family protein
MNELADLLLRATVWMTIASVLLACLRPLLLRLGGAALAYRSWVLIPLLLLAVVLPLPPLVGVEGIPLPTLVALPSVAAGVQAFSLDGMSVLLFAWGAGVAVTLARACIAQRRFVRAMGPLQRRDDGSWQATSDPGLPALVGLLRPRVVVGPAFDSMFDARQRALVLRHEHSHRAHGDPWANAALLLLHCLFWFHPLGGWTARRFQRDQELACDARVLADDPAQCRSYAMALLAAQGVHPGVAVACHWRGPSQLKERIAMLKQGKRGWVSTTSGQLLLAGLCIGAGGIAWAGQAVQPPHIVAPASADRQATAIQMVAPAYPKDAFERSIAGNVMLRVVVGTDGTPTDIRVTSATVPGVFDAAAVQAARQWTFQPALKDGVAVATTLQVPVTFSLDNDGPLP